MGSFRFSVASMLVFVALLGLWFAALGSAAPQARLLTSTLTLLILLSAVLGGLFLRAPARAFATGFALFGWVYLVLVGWEWVGGQFGHDLTVGLSDVAEWLIPDKSGTVIVGNIVKRADLKAYHERVSRIGNFVQISRLSMSLLFALVGGLIARAMARRTEATRGASSA